MGWNTVHITTIDLTAFCFLRSWFRRLRREGHRVTLLTTVENFAAPLREVCDELVHVPIPRSIQPMGDARALWQLTRELRRIGGDIVHTHTSKAGLLGRLAGRLSATPRVLHTIHELPQNAARNRWLKRAYWAAEKLAAGWADHFVTVSHINFEQIVAEGIAPPGKISVIPNGLHLSDYRIQTGRAELLRQWDLPQDALVMLTSGRLETVKGHTYLLQALPELSARIPRLYWVCSGRGELAQSLREQAVQLGVSDRVRWLGWIDDLPSTLGACDFFVLPTLYEGQGVVLLEAMALEKAVICSRVGGTQDVLVDGETGLFVPPRQPQALIEAVVRLCGDETLRRRLGKAGRRRLENNFLAEHSDAAMLALYRSLLERR